MQNGAPRRRHPGGGVAGLTLALQLKQRLPKFDVPVPERRTRCRGRRTGWARRRSKSPRTISATRLALVA
jgi:2-polyprenyl-6-methoxyphenol hydroxylase-like FAD-dependent oxidoreductase